MFDNSQCFNRCFSTHTHTHWVRFVPIQFDSKQIRASISIPIDKFKWTNLLNGVSDAWIATICVHWLIKSISISPMSSKCIFYKFTVEIIHASLLLSSISLFAKMCGAFFFLLSFIYHYTNFDDAQLTYTLIISMIYRCEVYNHCAYVFLLLLL